MIDVKKNNRLLIIVKGIESVRQEIVTMDNSVKQLDTYLINIVPIE